MSEHIEFLKELPPLPEEEFCIFGKVYAFPEHADALEAVYAQTTELAKSEPGTIYYAICRDENDRNLFHFFERYAGKRAFEAHVDHPIQRKLQEDKLMRGVTADFVKAIKPVAYTPPKDP